jgi:hypothetical protein
VSNHSDHLSQYYLLIIAFVILGLAFVVVVFW